VNLRTRTRMLFTGTPSTSTASDRPPVDRHTNGGIAYPYAEVVLLNTTLDNIAAEGWGDADEGGNVHFWEYNSHNPDGSPVDLSHRVGWSRQLDPVADAKRIADYSRPEFVLAGWKPQAEALK
jgi:hypothetical protein